LYLWRDFTFAILQRTAAAIIIIKIIIIIIIMVGRGSVVGIATPYRLDGPGIESRCGRDFLHLSRPALRPTQPPVKGAQDRETSRGEVSRAKFYN